MDSLTRVSEDGRLAAGIFLSEHVRLYDSVRQQQGFLNRLTKTMLQKAFPGMTMGVRGNIVAADILVQALLQEGNIWRYELVVPAAIKELTERQVGSSALSCGRKEQIRVTSIDEIVVRRDMGFQPIVWFNPLPAISDHEGIELSQSIRQSCSDSIYPVAILTHGLSYHRQLYDYFCRILLEGTYDCDSFICTSRSSRDAVIKIIAHIEEEFHKTFGAEVGYRGRVDLIPLCVDTSTFSTHDKSRARDLLRLPKEAFLILMLGRLSPLKADLYPFVPVLKSLVQRNVGRRLLWVVAGTEDEGYTRALQQQIDSLGLQKHLRIMLQVTDTAKALLMQSADVFMSPTDCPSESFGLTVIEAMASGVPQVVPDWDGYHDTVHHGETGFLVPTRWADCCDDLLHTGAIRGTTFDQFTVGQSVAVDMSEMETYLHLLVNNEQLRSEMAERSRKRASACYSFRAVAKQYEELWLDLERIASRIAARPEVVQLSRPRYYHFFGHYASRSLSDETPLEITSAGRQITRAKRIVPAYPAFLSAFQILDEDVLRKTLELATGQNLPKVGSLVDVRLGTLVQALRKECAYHPDHLCRHIMWLIKYGYLSPLDDR